ncbi:MAG TPA: LuxR C-terminal-related transcriptional regulator [Rugosimonospora sp.]|nr:LuxR C-terminal-related transcriptional regulator [Rugosimonospora sp.]
MAVSVVGAVGVGKTALLAGMAAAARALGFRVVRLGLDEECRPDVLIRLLCDTDATGDDLRVALESRPTHVPLLVILDDLRWCEPTLATLEKLFSVLTTKPLVCVLARRPDRQVGHLDQLFRYAEEKRILAHLPVRRLSDDAVANVVEDMLGAVPNEALTELAACAEGNAGALIALVDGLVQDGVIRWQGGAASLLPEFTGTAEIAPLPDCLKALVQRKLDTLSPQTRQMLDVAAVLGRTFAPDDVARMLGEPVAVLAPAFGEAHRAGVLDCGAEPMRFRRVATWQSVLRKIPVSIRNALNLQAAELLFTRSGAVADLARHLLGGAMQYDTLTLEMLRQTSEQTLDSSPQVAAELAQRGRELVRGDSEEWLPLTLIAVEACTRVGWLSRAVEVAAEAFRREVPPEPMRALRYWLATALMLQGHNRDAAEVASGVLTDPSAPVDVSRRLVRSESMAATLFGLPAAAMTDALPADPMLAWRAGLVTDAVRMSDEALRTEQDRLPVSWLGHPRLVHATVLTGLRDVEGARAAIAELEQHVDPALAGVPKLLSARIDLALGRSERAATAATACLALAKEGGLQVYVPAALTVVTAAALRRADIAAKLAEDPLVAWALAEMEGRWPVALEWMQARLALAQDKGHDCTPVLDRVNREPAGRRLLFIEEPAAAAWIVRMALAVDEREWAVTAVDTAQRLADENPKVQSLQMSVAHARGLLDGDQEELAQAAQGHPDLWARASAAEDLGAGLVGVDRDAAITRLETAAALYESVEAEQDVARVHRRLRELGVVKRLWRARAEGGTFGLTEMERAVATLVATGLTNKQIAARMFISRHTVAFHLRKVFRKLDIGSRIELARHIHASDA